MYPIQSEFLRAVQSKLIQMNLSIGMNPRSEWFKTEFSIRIPKPNQNRSE